MRMRCCIERKPGAMTKNMDIVCRHGYRSRDLHVLALQCKIVQNPSKTVLRLHTFLFPSRIYMVFSRVKFFPLRPFLRLCFRITSVRIFVTATYTHTHHEFGSKVLSSPSPLPFFLALLLPSLILSPAVRPFPSERKLHLAAKVRRKAVPIRIRCRKRNEEEKKGEKKKKKKFSRNAPVFCSSSSLVHSTVQLLTYSSPAIERYFSRPKGEKYASRLHAFTAICRLSVATRIRNWRRRRRFFCTRYVNSCQLLLDHRFEYSSVYRTHNL